MPKVFVYGTLKTGHGNYGYYLKNKPGVRFLGTGQTLNPFHMRDCGFPILLREGDPMLPACGEVFEVPSELFGPLDRLEGNGQMYERDVEPIRMLGQDGEPVEAWVYIGMPEHWEGYQRLRLAGINDHAAWEWGR